MNILFPIAEAAPLYKIGGLGDVGGALPKALAQLGIDVRIILPQHPEIIVSPDSSVKIVEYDILYSGKSLHIAILSTMLPGTSIPVYLVNEPTYLSTHTGASDNHADKFAVFSLAVSAFISEHSPYWQPHIIHCHDWHTALIPVILKHSYNSNIKTILTIHNLAYQGVTKTPVVKNLNINPKKCKIISWDSEDGDTNILMEGLLHCDYITTVSPNYAKEILTLEYGEKISHLLEARGARIKGILNGIDVDAYNPSSDSYIPARFDSSDWQSKKAKNRQELRKELGMSEESDQIMIGFVGRVDPYQKGIGLMIQAMREKLLPPENADFIFLGVGDPSLESELHQAGLTNPHIRIITRFDEALAHMIYAAAHVALIPSRFEPCGLVQLIAMRYGCLPVARATGGLIDTVFHKKNGFLFNGYNTPEMMQAINTAMMVMQDQTKYSQMVKTALDADYSWNNSAREYDILYKELTIGKNYYVFPHD